MIQIWLVRQGDSVGLHRSEIDGYFEKVAVSVPETKPDFVVSFVVDLDRTGDLATRESSLRS